MPETRVVSTTYDQQGNIVEQIAREFSDEELAVEAENRALAKADKLVDAITNLAEAKIFLKRLVARLIRKGLLP